MMDFAIAFSYMTCVVEFSYIGFYQSFHPSYHNYFIIEVISLCASIEISSLLTENSRICEISEDLIVFYFRKIVSFDI
jgi:hypothetical protein